MLIKCEECNANISDKAATCPQCGYPIKPTTKPSSNKNKKRPRLPNGFGQISKIKKNLRSPYRVMVTVGTKENGKPICKLLKPVAYFETYNDAYSALIDYNRNLGKLPMEDLTMAKLYECWSENHFKVIKTNRTVLSLKLAWRYCHSIHNTNVTDIGTKQLKHCIENAYITDKGNTKQATVIVKNRVKSMFNLMFDYALEEELVTINHARAFRLSPEISDEYRVVKKPHIAFDSNELNILWGHISEYEIIDMMLINCYSGWRPQELCNLEISNIDLVNWTFTGGMKTKSGKNRVVPHGRFINI